VRRLTRGSLGAVIFAVIAAFVLPLFFAGDVRPAVIIMGGLGFFAGLMAPGSE